MTITYTVRDLDSKAFKIELFWYIGSKSSLKNAQVSTVTEVQADGDELQWVLDNITGIPTNKNRVVRWFGDHAKFIAGSLR